MVGDAPAHHAAADDEDVPAHRAWTASGFRKATARANLRRCCAQRRRSAGGAGWLDQRQTVVQTVG